MSKNIDHFFSKIIKNDIFINQISLSELGLFAWASSRTLWYLKFGVVTPNFDYIFNPMVWISFFSIISISHLIGLVYHKITLRITALVGYSLAWGCLAFFSLWQGSKTTAFPAYTILTITSLIVIFHLIKNRTS